LVGKTKIGKGTKVMVLVDGNGTPLGINVANANRHEVKCIEPLLKKQVYRKRKPKRLLYDKAADSNILRRRLKLMHDVRLISPYRKRRNQSKARKLNSRDQSWYQHRWKVERTISWLTNCRRIDTRYEYHAYLFKGFCELACLYTILKRF
jgi:transposase